MYQKYSQDYGANSRLYRIWKCMKFRCYQKIHPAYKRYSSKGIIVYDEWKNDYLKFKEWALKNGYKDNLTIDRIDNNGSYTPSNCRWVTSKQNSNNKDDTIYLTIFGEQKTMSEWLEDKRCVLKNYKQLWRRIKRGIDSEKAITKKKLPKSNNNVTTPKLTEEDVLKIRNLCNTTDLSNGQISKLFLVNNESIRNIRLNKTWKHLSLPYLKTYNSS